MRRGEVRWCTLRGPDKVRPVVILTRNSGIPVLNSVTVAAVTSTLRTTGAHVLLSPDEDGMPQLCVVSLDNVQTVRKSQIGALITTLSSVRMREVEEAACFALGIDWAIRAAGE